MKRWIIAVTLALVAIAPMAYLAYHFGLDTDSVEDTSMVIQFQTKKITKLEPGAEIEVVACKVIDGYRFALYLAGDQWIEAHLPIATKDGAAQVVTDLLQKTLPPPPTVLLKRNVGGYWIVDFYVESNGERKSVVKILKEKDLLLY